MKVSDALREFPAISLKGKDQEVLATPPNCLESYPLERKNKPPKATGRGVFFNTHQKNASILAHLEIKVKNTARTSKTHAARLISV